MTDARELARKILLPYYFHFRDPALLPQRADDVRSVARAYLELLDHKPASGVLTRDQLRDWYVEFVGPPIVQPAMGVQERQSEAHKRRVDRFVDGLWAFLEPRLTSHSPTGQTPEGWRPLVDNLREDMHAVLMTVVLNPLNHNQTMVSTSLFERLHKTTNAMCFPVAPSTKGDA